MTGREKQKLFACRKESDWIRLVYFLLYSIIATRIHNSMSDFICLTHFWARDINVNCDLRFFNDVNIVMFGVKFTERLYKILNNII